MRLTISTTIDAEIHKIAKDNNIAWNDALEFGIKFLIAQKEGFNYPDNSLSNKIINLTKLLQDKCDEIEKLKSSVQNEIDAEKEADEVFKNILEEKHE